MHSNLIATMRAIASAVLIGVCLTVTASAVTLDVAREQAWRAAIAHTPVPSEGCFTASYPLLVWHQMPCATAPKQEFLQPHGFPPDVRSVTGGDYAAITKSRTTNAVGSFPLVKHLKSEQGPSGANDYALQLNSNYIPNDKACAGEGVAGACQGWQQFVFLNLYQNAYIQYWLVYYNNPCPAGWNAFPTNGSCWKNSDLVAMPEQAITELPNMSLSGSVVAKGIDTLVLTTKTQAYSTTGKDSVLDLARDWHGTDFNVLASGGGEAVFNAGASLTDRVDLTDGSTKKPTCVVDGGHSAETNNLVPGPCKVIGGSVPAMQFVETAPSP